MISSQSLSARPFQDEDDSVAGYEVDDLRFEEQGLSFHLSGGDIGFDQEGQLTALGLNGRTQQPGAPSLPFYSTWLVLPPEASISVTVEEPFWIKSPISEVPPVERNEFSGLESQGVLEAPPVAERSLVRGQEILAFDQDAFFPQLLFEYSQPMYIRDIRLVKLSIYPLRYNPVQKHLEQAKDLSVSVTFNGTDHSLKDLAPSYNNVHGATISRQVLNWDQGKKWRGLPVPGRPMTTSLPIGVDLYKIEVDSDGIFKIGYDDLQSAGMDVDIIDPGTFEMLHRGQPVAFSFIGNDDASFEPGEYIQFYGWDFDGSRLEKQFVSSNVFWLWAGGTPTYTGEVVSVPGVPVESFRASVTREPENVWFASWTDQWEFFPNEPDAWYWDRLLSAVNPVTRTYEITLPNPFEGGLEASFIAEFSSKGSPYSGGEPQPHIVDVSLNSGTESGSDEWLGIANVNITGTAPISQLQDGINLFEIVYTVNNQQYPNSTAVYLNRLSVEFPSEFVAIGDELIFQDDSPGSREYSIRNINQNEASEVIVWDVSDRLFPISILTDSISISGDGPYTYTFGTANPTVTKFVVTTRDNLQPIESINRVVLNNIDPQGAGADWVAISYSDFITEVERLAAHRRSSSFGVMDTHVVDVESVINQYGYGLPLPSALQNYLIRALTEWEQQPTYALFVGDSTVNPHNNLYLGKTFFAQQLVPTDLPFVDRFQGQIPSDHLFSMLIGDDLLPDISVGRIPVSVQEEAAAVVDKVLQYENNQLLPADWMHNILHFSDTYDPDAGDFCFENQQVRDHFPNSFNVLELCLRDNPTITDVNNFRSAFFTITNEVGTTIVNYRGHGGVKEWGDNEVILTSSHVEEWNNPLRPVAITSGDCLDGYFALPPFGTVNNDGLAETFLRIQDGGSSAHWSSSGLGFSDEHSKLVEEFYDGLFLGGFTAIGDATNFAKLRFYQDGGHQSLMYSFILEGDPAMQMMRPALSIDKSTTSSVVQRGDLIDYSINVFNSGVYPSHVVVTDTLPYGLSFITATSSLSAAISLVGNDVVFDLQFGDALRNKGLPRDATATLTITAEVDQANVGGALSNFALIGGTGLEAWPGDESDSATIYVIHDVLLPALFKQ